MWQRHGYGDADVPVEMIRLPLSCLCPVPHASGLAQSSGTRSGSPVVGADSAHSRDFPSEDSGSAQHPAAPVGPRVAFV